MKKIAIGINLFGKNSRVDLAIESLIRMKKKFPNDFDLYNIQFVDKNVPFREHPEYKLIRVLKETNHDYVKEKSKRTMPMTKEIFDRLAELEGYTHICLINDDIILSDRFFKLILNSDYDAYPFSRLAIKPIKTLEDNIVAEHYQVSGIDAVCLKRDWWLENRERFPTYVLGAPVWDIHYATICMRYGNSTLCNKWPASIFHIIHGDDSQLPSPETRYNYDTFWKPYQFDSDMWHSYLFRVTLRRPGINYWQHHENELELEKKFFNESWFRENYWHYPPPKLG